MMIDRSERCLSPFDQRIDLHLGSKFRCRGTTPTGETPKLPDVASIVDALRGSNATDVKQFRVGVQVHLYRMRRGY